MGSIWYHENFKRLYRCRIGTENLYSTYNFLLAYETPGGIDQHFVNIKGENVRLLLTNGSTVSDVFLYGMSYVAKILNARYGHTNRNTYDGVYWYCFTIGNYSGSWDDVYTPPVKISTDLYTLSLTGMTAAANQSLSQVVPTVTITNQSESTISFNYLAFTPNLGYDTGSSRATLPFLFWVYRFDSEIRLAPGESCTVSFSPWAS